MPRFTSVASASAGLNSLLIPVPKRNLADFGHNSMISTTNSKVSLLFAFAGVFFRKFLKADFILLPYGLPLFCTGLQQAAF